MAKRFYYLIPDTAFAKVDTLKLDIVRAYRSATPGLVIHRPLRRKSSWAITHEDSGKTVVYVPTLPCARYVSAAMGCITDWTLSDDTIIKRVDKESQMWRWMMEWRS